MISNSDESLLDSFPERYRKSNFRMFPVSPTVHLEEYVDWRTLAMREIVRSSDGESVADFEKRKQRMLGYIGRNNDLMTTIREEVSPEMKARQLAVSIENKRQRFLNKVVQQMEGKTEDQDAIKQKPAAKKWKSIPIRPQRKSGTKPKDPQKAEKVVAGSKNKSSVLQRASAPSTVKPFKLLPPIGIEKKNENDLGVNGKEEKKVKWEAVPIRHTKKSAQMADQMKAKINPETVHTKSAVPRTSHALTDLVPGSSSKKKRHKVSKPDMPRNNSSYSTLYDLPMPKVTSTFPGLKRALPPIGGNDKKPGRISSCDVRKSERLNMSVPSKDNTSSASSAVFKSVTSTEASSGTPELSARSRAHNYSRSRKDSSSQRRRLKADRSTESVKGSLSGRITKSPSSPKCGVGSVIYNTPSGSTKSVPAAHSNTPTQSIKAPSVNSTRSSRSSASILSTNNVRKVCHNASVSGRLYNGNTNVKEPPDILPSRSVSPLSVKSRHSITNSLPPVGMAGSSTSIGITSKASNVKPKERPSTSRDRAATLRASTPNLPEYKANRSRCASRTITATPITARSVSRSTATTPRPVSRSTATTPRPVSRSTATTPRPVSRSTATTPRPVSRSTATTPRPVSCSTATTPRPVSRSTATTPRPVSRSTATTPRPVSRSTATTPRPVSRSTATTPRPVSRSTATTPRPVSRSTATTPRHVSRTAATTPRPVSRSTTTTPRPVSRSMATIHIPVSRSSATTPRPVSHSAITTPDTNISANRSKSTAEVRRTSTCPNSSVTGKSARR